MGKIHRKELRFLRRIKNIYPCGLGVETAIGIKKELGKLLQSTEISDADKIPLRKRWNFYVEYLKDEIFNFVMRREITNNPLPRYL